MANRLHILITLFLSALLVPWAHGQSLDLHMQRLKRRSDEGMRVAVFAKDLRSGAILAELRPQQGFVPASNMKLVTTAAALTTLGKDFSFVTQLLRHGNQLIVVGDGDPAFGDPSLLAEQKLDPDDPVDRWAAAVLASGMHHVDRLVINDRAFDHTQRVHAQWPTDQLDKWYCAQVAAINYNNNCIDLFAEPTGAGELAKIRTLPSLAPVELDNRVKTGKDNAFWATRRAGSNRIVLRGRIRQALPARIQVTIDDPSMYFGRLLQRRIEVQKLPDGKPKVRVGQVVRIAEGESAAPDAVQVLAEHRTPIHTVLLRCNRDSQNLFAESLIRRLGHQITSEPGTWSNGSAAVRMFLSRVLKTDAATVVVDDGSGMSRRNRISASSLVRLLQHMHGNRTLGPIYHQSLASPDLKKGTLRKRFRTGLRVPGLNTPYMLKGEVRAKSGYLNGVMALSGYLQRGDRTIAFSMMLNNYKHAPSQGKLLIDQTILWLDKQLFDEEAQIELDKLLATAQSAKKLKAGPARKQALAATRSDLATFKKKYAGTPASKLAAQHEALVPTH